MSRATVLFLPHGGGPLPLMDDPGHAEVNRFLRAFPQTVRRPDAIIVISAHWETEVTTITSAVAPPMLFDYYGFPPETYAYQYPAPGAPLLAERARQLLKTAGIKAQLDSERGFDHGVFVPLLLMYPQPDIPCIQISLCSSLDAALHVQVGKALADLLNDNLLILGSGFSFHNLSVIMNNRGDANDDRNRAFESWLMQTCTDPELSEAEREAGLINWEAAPHARYCHPREEHLLPLQVCYGMSQSCASMVFQAPVAGFLASAYQW